MRTEYRHTAYYFDEKCLLVDKTKDLPIDELIKVSRLYVDLNSNIKRVQISSSMCFVDDYGFIK